jgi:hypothetical protein
MRKRLLLLAALPLLLLAGYGSRWRGGFSAVAAPRTIGPAIRLTDATPASGIRFTRHDGGSGRHYYVETMGGGGAFFDFDSDGWQDVLLLQGAPLLGTPATTKVLPALYRNNGNGTFTDVTQGSGLDVPMYGLGIAAGDYDNDGRPDLYVTALGGNRLFHNEGGGRFRDVTQRAGVAGRDMSTSTVWLDYDQDGWLDLFVCRYMDYDLSTNPRCKDALKRPAYCSPHVYERTRSLLFHNNGDGTFTDVSHASGIARIRGRAMGVACADYDEDGRVDLYVSNDLSPNWLFLNNGNGSFREEGGLAGVSHGENGVAHAGMGVDCADYQNEGAMSLVITNFENEPTSLFRNYGKGAFTNESYPSGIGAASLPYLKWGCQFVDLDRDGLLDLFVANGHVDDYADEAGKPLGYAQPCQVLHNEGNGRFADISKQCGPFFTRRQVARGAAFGDYDNDGDVDVLVTCINQPAILLRNDSRPRGPWLRLSLVGLGCNRDALGARVRVTSGAVTQTRFVRSGTSYLSDHDRRLLFGIGAAPKAQVEVRWLCGAAQRLPARARQSITIQETGCRLMPRSVGR